VCGRKCEGKVNGRRGEGIGRRKQPAKMSFCLHGGLNSARSSMRGLAAAAMTVQG